MSRESYCQTFFPTTLASQRGFRTMAGSADTILMLIVGVVEIAAGIGVAWKPRIFAYLVMAWLAVIITNLLLIPGYFDVALRDFGLFVGALALARLSQAEEMGRL